MSDRIDELAGNVKQGLGDLVGNKRLAAEGEGQSDKARATRKAKGALREAGGAVKEKVGELLGADVTQAEGTVEKLRGKAERTD